ncbi:alkylation response protein AidB-like acyl-CoA dehydrogenase [Nocardioides daedukensis]|uniref:Alkylation response protein AidB-like acyl-CoA dehydrogenase n=1 Tax=Nocardioides daedukensis TaxID=634462 RepID=A0A7Y9UPQ1_9ACTN|nr:acyl-CoA dehydrogenase family protein [Nocardioides daedukensis]NYG59833.1 alkylation response protein AidB-like acyl-CoA dehydrogenase [Nocardioides daedukensis]
MTAVLNEPTTSPKVEDRTHLERAKAVAEIVEAEANAIEEGATITKPVYDALVENRLFWMAVPKELNGMGLGLVESFEVIEELSRADGSTGWAFMANSLSTSLAAGFLAPQGQQDLFAHDVPGITAGMILPTGSGRKVEGGYVVTGNYQFASGSAHASWIGAGFVVSDEEGNPLTTPEGGPVCRTAFVPRDEAEFRGNWNVWGLVGTGSYDYGLTEVFIPEEHCFDTFTTEAVRSEPLFRFGLLGIGVGGHAPVALGIARRALDEIVKVATVKGRVGYPTVIADSEIFKLEFAKTEALYRAARAYVYEVHREAEDWVNAGNPLTELHNARLRQSITWVQEVTATVTNFAHRWGGSQSFRNPTALGRATRDAAVATQHLLVDPMSMVDAAGAIMGEYGNGRS